MGSTVEVAEKVTAQDGASVTIWPQMHWFVLCFLWPLPLMALFILTAGPERMSLECAAQADHSVECKVNHTYLGVVKQTVKSKGVFTGASVLHRKVRNGESSIVRLEGSGGQIDLLTAYDEPAADGIASMLSDWAARNTDGSIPRVTASSSSFQLRSTLLVGGALGAPFFLWFFYFIFCVRTTFTVRRESDEIEVWTRRWPSDGERRTLPLAGLVDVIVANNAPASTKGRYFKQSIAAQYQDGSVVEAVPTWYRGQSQAQAAKISSLLFPNRIQR